MNKKTLKLIWNLNDLYDLLFTQWPSKKNDDILDYQSKLKLIKVITKNIIEKDRWFLKSNLNYKKVWHYILENYETSYTKLHSDINNILLNI